MDFMTIRSLNVSHMMLKNIEAERSISFIISWIHSTQVDSKIGPGLRNCLYLEI